MATERKRSVTTTAREAGKIKKLLEADLSANFDTLKTDIKALTQATTDIAKWDEVLADLEGPEPVKASAPAAANANTGGDAAAQKSASGKNAPK